MINVILIYCLLNKFDIKLKLFHLHVLRLPGTYTAKIDKIRPPLHVSLNNSVTRPYLKNLTGNVFTKWPIIEGNVQGGSDFHLL